MWLQRKKTPHIFVPPWTEFFMLIWNKYLIQDGEYNMALKHATDNQRMNNVKEWDDLDELWLPLFTVWYLNRSNIIQ